MKKSIPVAMLIIAALLFCGCTSVPGGEISSPQDSGGADLVPGPTQTLPSERDVTITVHQKDSVYGTIMVTFDGGKGQVAVTDILVTATLADGRVLSEHLKPEKGTELKFPGTKETDRIEVSVTLNTGITYKIIDEEVPYRTRG